jgi:hypothetical protein
MHSRQFGEEPEDNRACRQTGSYPETGFEEVGRISNDKPAYQY